VCTGAACEVKSMTPVYPKERVPGRTNFVLEARGQVMTAPPDSQVPTLLALIVQKDEY